MQVLMEHEAKALLRKYGVKATAPRLVQSAQDALAAAQGIGAPVVLKIASPDILHKARVGGVRLAVQPRDAGSAYEEIMASARNVTKARIAGVLVEPMVEGGTELIIGGKRDPHFGPVVMFGMGGTSVEKTRTVAFRLAPISEAEARDLIASTTPELTRDVETAEKLISILLAVAGPDGALVKEDIRELDINPVIVNASGVVAVDALAILGSGAPGATASDASFDRAAEQKQLYQTMKAAFEPSGIVVVGASATPGKLGFTIVRNLVDYGFKRPIFGVHPTANNVYGCPTFASVSDLPHDVDRAMIVVPAAKVAHALEQCAAKGVRVAQIYSAGFAEWSDEGKALEQSIREIVARTGMRVIGPNTIGTFSASGGLTLTVPRYSPRGEGTISFVAQSGTYALDAITRSRVLGLPLGKSVSCGNCVDLGPLEYLLYFAEDPGTDIIAMYLESVPDAGRFFRCAAQIDKPIVLLKGGQSAAGLQAASSHTGALATDSGLWEAAAKQAGAVVVDTLDELIDVLQALTAFGERWRLGRRLGVFTSGGGISVGAADAAATADLAVAELTENTRKALARFGVPGTSVKNPVDIPVWGLKADGRFIFNEMIDVLAADENVDSVVACVEMGSVFSFSADEVEGLEQMELISASILANRSKRPVSAVFRTTGDKVQDDYVRAIRPRMLARGIPVYEGIERAIHAHATIARARARLASDRN
jgi:acyl-CoA synthetase (NDP forming)